MIVNLAGKKGLIIGIANEHSIAYGCAKKFREAGAELAITYLNEKSAVYVRPLAEQLQSPLILPCDVQQEEQIVATYNSILETWGKLDFLLHSIAFAPKEDLQNKLTACSKNGFITAMDISCYSLINLTRHAQPLMSDGGSILTVSYYGSQKVIANYSLMGIVKAALESTTRYLAYELGTANIRVNALSPGPIQTRAASGILNFHECLEQEVQKSPLHRLVNIDNVGNLAAFMASDAAGDITGQTLYIDAGYSIMG
ncbi:enoyl-ACP reductase FabI [soil metagenome]